MVKMLSFRSISEFGGLPSLLQRYTLILGLILFYRERPSVFA